MARTGGAVRGAARATGPTRAFPRSKRRARERADEPTKPPPTAPAARGRRCWVEGQLLVLHQRQAREAPRELRERQLGLELAEARAQAVVDAAAEGEVAAGLSRSRSKASGSGKTDGSRPAAASQRKSLAPAGSSTAADARRPRRHAPPDADRGIEAQRLLDRGRDRAPGRPPRAPSARVLEQAPHEVADEVVRRLVAGEAQREADRGDLVEREGLGVLVVDVDQRAREVVGAARDALVHQPPQVARGRRRCSRRARPAPRAPRARRSARRGNRTSA